jgi:hypothetical protein
MRRSLFIGAPVTALLALAALVTVAAVSPAPPAPAATLPATGAVSGAPVAHVYVHPVADVPVLAWHQIIAGVATTPAENQIWNFNQECSPDAQVCAAANNDETVSLTQFDGALKWLKASGYQSITAAEYQAWMTGKPVALPAKPVLLTDDDGTLNSFYGVTATLAKYGFNMVAFIVSQFADGATDRRHPYIGWDASWSELLALPAAQWSFAFHAGPQGHNVAFPDNPGCTYFYSCQLPTESAAAYQYRVSNEITVGRKVELQKLGSRLNDTMWAVPWNDLAQGGHPESGADPAKWLAPWAATQFPIVFLQDPKRNGVAHERYRLEVQGTWDEATFEGNVAHNTADGFFNLRT